MSTNIPPLVFNGFKVTKVLFNREDLEKDPVFEVNIQFLTEFPNPQNELIFNSVFIIDMNGLEVNFKAQIQVVAFFKIDGEVDHNIKENYTQISAPSIIFPYIRAFISNLFLSGGANPIILPPINFIERYHESKQKKVSQDDKVTQDDSKKEE